MIFDHDWLEEIYYAVDVRMSELSDSVRARGGYITISPIINGYFRILRIHQDDDPQDKYRVVTERRSGDEVKIFAYRYRNYVNFDTAEDAREFIESRMLYEL